MQFFILSLFLAALRLAPVSGGDGVLAVEPSLVVLTKGKAEAMLTLRSTAKTELRLRLRVDADAAASGGGGAHALSPYLTLGEETVTLQPGESHAIPIRHALPAAAEDGEYFTRLLISQEGSGQDGAAAWTVPVLLRKGDVYADIKLGKIGAVREEGEVRIAIDLVPLGNAGYRGNMLLTVANQKGKTIHTLERQVDVFETTHLVIPIASAAMPPGQYTVKLHFNSDRPDLGADAIPVFPKNYTVKIKMP